MFPNDAKTFFSHDTSSSTSGTLLSSVSNERTILSLGINCDEGSNNSILSGGSKVAFSEDGYSFYKNVSFKQNINTVLTYTKSSGADCAFTVIYVDYDLSTMGTGAPAFYSGDGLFMSLLLLILVIFGIIGFVWASIRSVGVHKKYMGVNVLEGKELYDI